MNNDDIQPSSADELDLSAAQKGLDEREKYGGRPLEAGVGQFLSTATFGGSDVLARAAGIPAEQLTKVREYQPEITAGAEALGIVAPAIATFGESTAAQALAAPLRGVEALGTGAETAAKALLPKGAATTIGGLAARGAAEGAAIGASTYANDVALEKEELSKEALMAHAGAGALFGGTFGATFGTAQASMPTLLKGAEKIGSKVSGAAKEEISSLLDPTEQAIERVTKTSTQAAKLKERLGTTVDELPNYLQKDLEYSTLETPATLAEKNSKVLKQTAKQLDDIATRIDDEIVENGSPVTRQEMWQPLKDAINDFKSTIEDVNTDTGRSQLRKANQFLKTIESELISTEPVSFQRFNDLRKYYQKIIYPGRNATASTKAEATVAEVVRKAMREQTDSLATKLSERLPGIDTELKEANKRYYIGKLISNPLNSKAKNATKFYGLTQFAVHKGAQTARNLAFKANIAEHVATVRQVIADGVASAFEKSKGKMSLPSSTILMRSGFAINDKGEHPKNNKEAFENIQNNLNKAVDPDTFVDMVAKKTSRVAQADPNVATGLQERLGVAVQFINSKMPKSTAEPGVFTRPYIPSSMELAKFQRYLQIVEQPLSALQELKQGTLTREHVEALQAVYPEIYREIQTQMMHKIGEGELKLSYEKKVQMGILLNVPADSSMHPKALMQLQQSINAQPEQQQPGPQFRPSGMQQTGISERAQTVTEKVQSK